jgi:hypothetical protein
MAQGPGRAEGQGKRLALNEPIVAVFSKVFGKARRNQIQKSFATISGAEKGSADGNH